MIKTIFCIACFLEPIPKHRSSIKKTGPKLPADVPGMSTEYLRLSYRFSSSTHGNLLQSCQPPNLPKFYNIANHFQINNVIVKLAICLISQSLCHPVWPSRNQLCQLGQFLPPFLIIIWFSTFFNTGQLHVCPYTWARSLKNFKQNKVSARSIKSTLASSW